MNDYEWVDHGRRRERLLLEVLNKPRMPGEARDILHLRQSSKLSFTFRELMDRGIIQQKVKGLYGLTERGQKLRSRLMLERGLPYRYIEPRIDWKTYVWVFVGRQRRLMLRVLGRHPKFAVELYKLAKRIHKVLSRSDAYKVLKAFVCRHLACAEQHSHRKTYTITRRGENIRDQLIAVWFALFMYL